MNSNSLHGIFLRDSGLSLPTSRFRSRHTAGAITESRDQFREIAELDDGPRDLAPQLAGVVVRQAGGSRIGEHVPHTEIAKYSGDEFDGVLDITRDIPARPDSDAILVREQTIFKDDTVTNLTTYQCGDDFAVDYSVRHSNGDMENTMIENFVEEGWILR